MNNNPTTWMQTVGLLAMVALAGCSGAGGGTGSDDGDGKARDAPPTDTGTRPGEPGEPNEPGGSGQAGQNGTTGEPGRPGKLNPGQRYANETSILERDFAVVSGGTESARVEVPPGTGMLRVWADLETGAAWEFFLRGLSPECDNLEMSYSTGTDAGKGGVVCYAPPAGAYDITWGVATGAVTGHLTIAALPAA